MSISNNLKLVIFSCQIFVTIVYCKPYATSSSSGQQQQLLPTIPSDSQSNVNFNISHFNYTGLCVLVIVNGTNQFPWLCPDTNATAVPSGSGIHQPQQETMMDFPSTSTTSTASTNTPTNAQPKPPRPDADGDTLSAKCLRATGQFPSSSCEKFVNCWNGVATEQSCPDGLLFSNQGVCDYPQNVDCGARNSQAVNNGISSSPSQPTASVPSSSQGTPKPTTAPSASTTATLPVDSFLRKLCLLPRGQFPSNSCNKYVNCWDEVVAEQECPEGLLFSDKTGYCDYPQNVECQGRASPPRGTEKENSFRECPLESGTFRDPRNCSNFFTCLANIVVAKYSCPEGFKFNDVIGVCDYEERVDCTKEPYVFRPRDFFVANVPQELFRQIDNCTPGTVFRLNPQCTAVAVCRGRGSEIIRCPDNLAYDSTSDQCLIPSLARC